MTPKILIHYTNNIEAKYIPPSFEHLACAYLAFVVDGKHFRCIKNRWDTPHHKEYIPLRFLTPYIMGYEEYFTTEDLVNALVYETTS